jgi:hypothetical protein
LIERAENDFTQALCHIHKKEVTTPKRARV